MPDDVNTNSAQQGARAAERPFTPPAKAIAMGMALIQNGDEGDATEVCGLGVAIGPHDMIFVMTDTEPEPVGPEEIERMAAFLIGVAGSLRQKLAARAAGQNASTPLGGNVVHIVNEDQA